MSKPKAKPTDAEGDRPSYDTRHITPASSLEEIVRARFSIESEIRRRRAYAELEAARQDLAETPPIPAPSPGND